MSNAVPGPAIGGPARVVHAVDAVPWLAEAVSAANADPTRRRGISVVSSIPDIAETGLGEQAWRAFFVDCAAQCLRLVDDSGLVVLFQTDTRKGGVWRDKSAMITEGVLAAGGLLLARKIVCRMPPGKTSTSRAAYSHLLIYGRRPLDQAFPDVVPDVIDHPGPLTWTRGVGLDAARAAMRFVRRHAPSTTTIIDPFCGEGMLLAAANEAGFDAVGVERHGKRAAQARRLSVAMVDRSPAVDGTVVGP